MYHTYFDGTEWKYETIDTSSGVNRYVSDGVGEYTSIAIDTNNKVHISNAMESDKIWSFTTKPKPDTISPTIISVSPVDGATNVAVNTTITATFSEPMDGSTINNSTFTVNGITSVVTYSDKIATFTPSGNLANNTIYTVTITTGVKDIAGNAMSQNKIWKFTTIAKETNGGGNTNGSGGKKSCLISTITQNTKLNEYQSILTNFRDKYLISDSDNIKSKIVNFYYKISPYIIKY